ncbi:prostamide/prostaglandin F synthase-like [Liolophura sinensis]|uniref:prostamide/prostaglandin F synthase-like n=1 Tax=Liolophura sinensis TaxID=3198878 RepID=UPI003159823C
MSTLKPQLDAHQVRLVGIGLEELGVEEFVEGNFFSGELYIDLKKECYQNLGFKRLGFFSAIGSVFSKKGREASSQAKADALGGNLKGDGFQNGGALVVSSGGDKVLLSFKQENPADHVELSEVLKSLGIEGAPEEDAASGQAKTSGVTCDGDVCKRT